MSWHAKLGLGDARARYSARSPRGAKPKLATQKYCEALSVSDVTINLIKIPFDFKFDGSRVVYWTARRGGDFVGALPFPEAQKGPSVQRRAAGSVLQQHAASPNFTERVALWIMVCHLENK